MIVRLKVEGGILNVSVHDLSCSLFNVMFAELSPVILIAIVAVGSYFGMSRKLANTVALRSGLSTDEIIEKSRDLPLHKVGIWLWCAGTILAGVASFYTGLEPIVIVIATLSQAPFLVARVQLYYKVGTSEAENSGVK